MIYWNRSGTLYLTDVRNVHPNKAFAIVAGFLSLEVTRWAHMERRLDRLGYTANLHSKNAAVLVVDSTTTVSMKAIPL